MLVGSVRLARQTSWCNVDFGLDSSPNCEFVKRIWVVVSRVRQPCEEG